MAQIKKIVCGTQRGLEGSIERHKASGWAVERTEAVPRGTATSKMTYTAYLKREKATKP